MANDKSVKKRVHEVDLLRGLLMLLVIIDHVFWFLKSYNLQWFNMTNIPFFNGVYGVFNFYWRSGARAIIRQIALFGFVFISGISCAFSRNNWKRAGIMVGVYFALTLVTNIAQNLFTDRSVTIDFNVIGVLAWSALIYCFVQNQSWKGVAAAGLGAFLFTIVVIPLLLSAGLGDAYIPWLWKGTTDKMISDWMPLFPYIVYFFMGAVTSRFLYPNKKSLFGEMRKWEEPICYVGRHCMWIYLFHEPILTAIFPLFGLLVGLL